MLGCEKRFDGQKTNKNKKQNMKTQASVEIVEVDCKIAEEWLSNKFEGQRTINQSHVARLASDMESGNFTMSPDAIVRVGGRLANGQHRLSAVIKSKRKVPFIVMTSEDAGLYKVIDCGLKRSAKDGLVGMRHAQKIPGIARWLMAYDFGKIWYAGSSGSCEGLKGRFTQVEVIDYCLEHKDDLVESVDFVWPLYGKNHVLNPSVAAALYLIARRNGNTEKVERFLIEVYSGEASNSVSIDFRNRLIKNLQSKSKLRTGYVFALAVKSFRHFINGTRPGNLKIDEDEGVARL